MLRLLVRAVFRFLGVVPCDECGKVTYTSLVIQADPAGRSVDGRTGICTRTYSVNSAKFLCQECKKR